jgi:Cysteine-rich CWC
MNARVASGYGHVGMNAERCESCGREFSCGAQDAECWCAALTLGPDRLAILREHFERCLCPDCLRLAARAQDAQRS